MLPRKMDILNTIATHIKLLATRQEVAEAVFGQLEVVVEKRDNTIGLLAAVSDFTGPHGGMSQSSRSSRGTRRLGRRGLRLHRRQSGKNLVEWNYFL